MPRHLGKMTEAGNLKNAAAVIAEGKSVTCDMKQRRANPTAVGTSQTADVIIEKLSVS